MTPSSRHAISLKPDFGIFVAAGVVLRAVHRQHGMFLRFFLRIGAVLGRGQGPNGDTIGFSQQNLECSACVGALVIIPNKVRVIQA